MQSNKLLLESKISSLINQVKESGSWKKPFKEVMINGLPSNYYSNNLYKGANIFFLWMEAIQKHYQTNYWLTLKQCNKLKAKVNKGEKASVVFFFKPLEVKDINDDGEAENNAKNAHI